MASGINFDWGNIGKFILRASLGIYFVTKGINFFVNNVIFSENISKISAIICAIGLPKFSITIIALLFISCGFCMTIGFYNRICALILSILMGIETSIMVKLHLAFLNDVAYPLLIAIALLSYVMFGAGKFSVDKS